MSIVMPGIVLVLLCMLIGGVVLLARGIRGRRMNDHPHCRKCGFDLVGLYRADDAGAGIVQCPECGTALATAKAIRIGRRQRRRGSVIAGLFLLLVPIGLGGAWLAGVASKINWVSHFPDWLLVWNLQYGSVTKQTEELQEAMTRIEQGEFDGSLISKVIDRVLEVQGNQQILWDPSWGQLFEIAHANGLVTEDQTARYIRQSMNFALDIRSPVAEDEQFVFSVKAINIRSGGFSSLAPFYVKLFGNSVKFQTIQGDSRVDAGHHFIGDSPWRFSVGFPRSSSRHRWSPHISAGEYEVSADFAAHATLDWEGNDTIGEWQESLTTRLRVVPRGTSTLTHDDKGIAAESLRQHISIGSIAVLNATPDGAEIRPNIYIDGEVPITLFFEIILRDRESPSLEWSVGHVFCTENGRNSSSHWVRPYQGFHAKNVDVILRSAPEVAREETDIYELWKGEIIIENVPVQWPSEE